jgi:L-threonylcarbamoyladenylate synthase
LFSHFRISRTEHFKILEKLFKMATSKSPSGYKTTILPKFVGDIGRFRDPSTLETWELPTNPTSPTLENINLAASHLLTTDIPVAFPTETVYGLGADATRSSAVKGIYTTKGRPSDNPLIIHVCDLTMLRSLLDRPIPDIYIPLIKKFWPGPLTILLPNPPGSKLAPEVTAGNSTFGARMPNTPLALSLIKAAGVPLAAPSANASTKPSPTTAQHVLHDLDGKIEFILDGGSCQVGLESTFVDGLASPPRILRPGGVSIDLIREVEGFEGVEKSYLDASEEGSKAPLAPGMKYKHYSPKAKVVLYEFFSRHLKFPDGSEADLVRCGIADEALKIIKSIDGKGSYLDYAEISKERVPKIGVVTTKHWVEGAGLGCTVSIGDRSPPLHSSPLSGG